MVVRASQDRMSFCDGRLLFHGAVWGTRNGQFSRRRAEVHNGSTNVTPNFVASEHSMFDANLLLLAFH